MLRRLATPLASAVTLVLACSGESAPTSSEQSDGGADARVDAMNFDPTGYPNKCTDASECVLAPVIRSCGTCCSAVPVRADGVRDDLEAAKAACRASARGIRNCLLECVRYHVDCVGGICVACTDGGCNDGGITDP